MDAFVRVNCLLAGLVITAGIYVQLAQVFRTKSAKDFALILVIALFYNELAWLVYGIYINEWPIVALCAVNLPADFGIAIGWILYSGKCQKLTNWLLVSRTKYGRRANDA